MSDSDSISLEETSLKGKKNAWQSRKPSFSRNLKAMIKKLILLKIRRPSSIIEVAIACVIYILLYPINIIGKNKVDAVVNPPLRPVSADMTNMVIFFAMHDNPRIAFAPDLPIVHQLLDDGLFSPIAASGGKSIEKRYFNNYNKEMKQYVSMDDQNGIGIYWANAGNDTENLAAPEIEVYISATYPDISNAAFMKTKETILTALKTKDPSLAPDVDFILNAKHEEQQYPSVELNIVAGFAVLYGIFCILPVILTTMPDFQTVLEDKDSHIAAFSFLMGCSETAYWMASFIMSFALSLLPYIVMPAMLCFGFGLKGNDFILLLVQSLLFIIAHICFIFFLSTFMKTKATGRSFTIVMLVISLFFADIHMFLTLDEGNKNDGIKHLFSIFPISCYQMIVMSDYILIQNSRQPASWKNMNSDMPYPTWMAFMWLIIDIVVYFFLFLLFNLTNKRDFGTQPLKWREIFNRDAWERVLGLDNDLAKVGCESDYMMTVKGLCKVYKSRKDVEAIKSVDFEIKNGEVIVIIGPNGAGKSTLINILAGAVEPTSGLIRLFGGNDTSRFKEVQKYLGVVFQDNVIINFLSVREHMKLFGAFRGINEDDLDDSIDFFASTLQLREMLDSRAGDLSGGQKRKLCIALALLGEPPIILMDEPTAGVDVQARQLIWKTIASLENSTSIITSHALEEAETVSSRLFIVSQGKIPFMGTSTELRNEFKCGYLLRVDREDKKAGPVLELAQSFISGSHILEDRPDTICIPVDSAIPQLIGALDNHMSEYEISSYSFSVEQLEDMVVKIVQADEALYDGQAQP